MTDVEHWIGVRMAAGYDDEDFRELVEHLNVMRSVAEAVVVESAEVSQPSGAVGAARLAREQVVALLVLSEGAQADVLREAVRLLDHVIGGSGR
jgi:hypothetical protein